MQPPYQQPGQYTPSPSYGQMPYGQSQSGQSTMPYAGVGARFVALFIDGLIIGAAFIIIALIAGFLFLFHPNVTGSIILIILASLIFIFFSIGYVFGLEATQGATLGKKALGLRVLKEGGTPIGWKESLIRNLLRIVDGLLCYLIGALIIWNSPMKQRMGQGYLLHASSPSFARYCSTAC